MKFIERPRRHGKVDGARRYATAVLAGEIPASQVMKAACQRYIDDLKTTRMKIVQAKCERICEFIELLPDRYTQNRIQLQDWQVFVLVNMFGDREAIDDDGWVKAKVNLSAFD